MVVTTDEILAIQAFVNKINNTPLEEIEWDFEVSEQDLADWRFTGLSNWTFAQMHGVYK